MAKNRYSIYPSSLVTSGGSNDLSQILGLAVQTAAEKFTLTPGGSLDPLAIVLMQAAPLVEIATHDLLSALTYVSITSGLYCSSGATFRLQQRAIGGTFSGGTNNVTISSTKGLAWIDGLGCAQGEPCNVGISYRALWDAATDPLVVNVGVNLSSVTAPSFNSLYFLGPTYYNSTLLETVKSVRIVPGVSTDYMIADGELYPQVSSIVFRRPTLQLTMTKAEWLSVSGLFNTALAASLVQYFARAVHGGSRVSYATGSHCKITAATGAMNAENVSVQELSDAMVAVDIGVTGTLAASVASTIP